MGKYRKRPIEVEAFQLNSKGLIEEDSKGLIEADWFWDAVTRNDIIILNFGEDLKDASCIIKTLEGDMIAHTGDYIVKGINGEIYPCKEDIFNKVYEKVI